MGQLCSQLWYWEIHPYLLKSENVQLNSIRHYWLVVSYKSLYL